MVKEFYIDRQCQYFNDYAKQFNDLHPFIHPFNPAIEPPWETKTNWDQFKFIAEKFSRPATDHLGVQKDLVAFPLLHDSPGETAQPLGRVKDWKKGEVEAVPGRTMPNLKVVTRDYADTFRMMTALGPLVRQPGIGVKGISWQAEEEYEELERRNGAVAEAGISRQMPDLTTARQAAEAILVLSPETNGSTAVKAWRAMEQKTGLHLTHLSAAEEGEKYTFERLINTPGSTISGKRGGTHNSVTRILMKPTQMIGGYAQLSYAFNYYGPTGAQRDEVIEVRKAREVQWYED